MLNLRHNATLPSVGRRTLVLGLATLSLTTAMPTAAAGIIGAGKIGGTLGELWVRAGHRVFLSFRHPEQP